MSKDFENFITEKDAEEVEALRLQRLQALNAEPTLLQDLDDPQETDINLRKEIHSQVLLLKAIRHHMFYANGQPKEDTEASDITSYMNSSMKLLNMLQSFESSLKTDEEVRQIETAIEMALEEVACPEFVDSLKHYLTEMSQ